ncbi:MAG: cytochrome c [Verrucomicrobiales bacterium]|nr:cytochrome c [Verrucomicrobiales bacterium]
MNGKTSIALTVAMTWAVGSLGAEERWVTLDNEPLGSPEKPLVLRTYFPDPGLGREVLANHDLSYRARKYSPGKGDVDGFDDPIRGIPAAIGVNFGAGFSYCWDTTECRLLFAWQGGFLKMENYWGNPESGRRKPFAYLPELDGPLIYLARGPHPLVILDDFVESHAPAFSGYRLVDEVPEFIYRLGKATIRVRIVPGEKPMTFLKQYVVEGAKEVAYRETGYRDQIEKETPLTFSVTVTGRLESESSSGELEPEYLTDKPNLEWGKALYTQLGCLACHSTDGTRGHGPTFAGTFGSERKITGVEDPVLADEAYLIESIKNPAAKVVESFPPGYMPPYPIPDDQVQSLVLFLQTLKNE